MSPTPEPGNTAHEEKERFPSLLVLGSILTITVLVFFLVRLAAPSELLDKDQERPAAYMMDILINGNWIIQRDDTGDISSKPSLYTWVSALASILIGRANEVSLYLPTGLAVLGTALLILFAGNRYYNRRVGMVAASMFLISMVAWKQVQLARTDPLFSFFTFAAVLVLYEVIRGRMSWVAFWVVASLVTLTKGPLGVLFAFGGLLAYLWERRRDDTPPVAPPRWGQQIIGVSIFLGLSGGWFFLAWLQMGQPLIDKMIGEELVGHAVAGERGKRPGEGLFFPSAYYLTRFAPWAILGAIAIVNVIRRPDPNPELRFLDRFLAAHFLLGLFVFSLAPNQRPDHLFPIIPASILLGARELERWWRVPMDRRGLGLYTVAAVIFIIGQTLYIAFYNTG
ncbi:MAG: glycosyltransferase family 39 protein [Candidatus Sumerlaeia bacterium]|nr:glycosyltransferase family 39 protein [Candidatus Sumerlaeia bacterium]